MPDAKGLRDLYCLLGAPGQDVPAVQLLNPQDAAVATVASMGADAVLDDEGAGGWSLGNSSKHQTPSWTTRLGDDPA